MDKNILLSKIVATPTESTWAQAYSTLNLYIVLSMSAETTSGSIVTHGKELFERIQREYFSLDEKNLSNIKKSIEAAIEPVEDKKTISIVLATIQENILYIIIVSSGSVILKRGEKVGPVADAASDEEISAFSGELKADDIVILETGEFKNKIPLAKLSETIDNLSVSEIAENLAPLVHENPAGSEAAIFLQYKNLTPVSHKIMQAEEMEDEIGDEVKTEKTVAKAHEEEESFDEPVEEIVAHERFKLPGFSMPKLKIFGTKRLIIAVILILIIVFVGSIFYEKNRQESVKRQAALTEILSPEEKKYDEAVALAALNKGLALDEFNTIEGEITPKLDGFKQGTPERKKLEEFIGKVEQKIGELGSGGTLSNQKMIYDKGADLVEFRGGTLSVVKKNTGAITVLDTDGSSKKEISTKNENVVALAGDDDSIYILGDSGVTKSDKKTGKTSSAIKDLSNTAAIDVFGSNLYGLNTKSDTVDKYAGQTSPRSDYFKGSVTLGKPKDMTIDGSVWILDGSKIRKFTKGNEDTFAVSGLTKDISDDAKIFTSADYSNVYVLDRGTTRIISISKDGEVKNQYVSKDLSGASSFAVDESGKKIYVVISGKLYSFDL